MKEKGESRMGGSSVFGPSDRKDHASVSPSTTMRRLRMSKDEDVKITANLKILRVFISTSKIGQHFVP